MRFLPPILLAISAAALCACGGDSGPADRVTLTFPHVLNTDHPVHKAIEKFKEEVEARSGGQMTVKIFPGGTIGNEQQLIDNVGNGSYDMTKVSSTVLETKTDLAKVYSLPYLFRDEAHFWKVVEGDIGLELLDMARDKNLKGICYFEAGARSFYSKAKPVESPADLAGVRVRVQQSEMMTELVASLGALPQQIPFSELYTALDRGRVDGAENNIPSYYTTQHYKVAPYYSFDEHVRVPDMVFINTKAWEKLSAEQQQVIMDSAAAAVAFQRELWARESERYMALLTEAGVGFARPDKAPFVEKTQGIYAAFEGTPVMDFADRIRAVE